MVLVLVLFLGLGAGTLYAERTLFPSSQETAPLLDTSFGIQAVIVIRDIESSDTAH